MPYVTARDGAQIFYTDWGNGPAVVLSHGWPLNADSWEYQTHFLASNGYRAIAHDRRGHGRSTQTWHGNEMNTYADDLSALITALDLRDVALVGFSAGGGEIARYIGRHSGDRVAKVALISTVSPFMLQTDDNPSGVPGEVFDGLRDASLSDRAQLYRDLADGPVFGNNRPGAAVSQGVRDAFWARGLQTGHRNAFECIAAFAATDFRPDLARFDMPTLVVHGDLASQVVQDEARHYSQTLVLAADRRERGQHVCVVDAAGFSDLLQNCPARCRQLRSTAPGSRQRLVLPEPGDGILGGPLLRHRVAQRPYHEVHREHQTAPEILLKGSANLQAGDRVLLFSAGGGGFGDPELREQEHIRRDVRRGYISPQDAQSIYGLADRDIERTDDSSALREVVT